MCVGMVYVWWKVQKIKTRKFVGFIVWFVNGLSWGFTKLVCLSFFFFYYLLSGMSQLSRLNSCVRLNFAFGYLFGIHNYEN